ncbi:MAG: NUDIX hydrolase [Dehalococcoidia bacterium]
MVEPATDSGHIRDGLFRFCPNCGVQLSHAYRGGRERPVCTACGFVQYRNPVVGVAVVVRDERGHVLMGKRAEGPSVGEWCIPCGYVEWGEEVREAARREFEEETGLRVDIGGVVAVHSNFHNPHLLTVGIWFEGRVVGGDLHPVDGEFSDLRYVDPAEPPSPLAFPTDRLVLEQLANERRGA